MTRTAYEITKSIYNYVLSYWPSRSSQSSDQELSDHYVRMDEMPEEITEDEKESREVKPNHNGYTLLDGRPPQTTINIEEIKAPEETSEHDHITERLLEVKGSKSKQADLPQLQRPGCWQRFTTRLYGVGKLVYRTIPATNFIWQYLNTAEDIGNITPRKVNLGEVFTIGSPIVLGAIISIVFLDHIVSELIEARRAKKSITSSKVLDIVALALQLCGKYYGGAVGWTFGTAIAMKSGAGKFGKILAGGIGNCAGIGVAGYFVGEISKIISNLLSIIIENRLRKGYISNIDLEIKSNFLIIDVRTGKWSQVQVNETIGRRGAVNRAGAYYNAKGIKLLAQGGPVFLGPKRLFIDGSVLRLMLAGLFEGMLWTGCSIYLPEFIDSKFIVAWVLGEVTSIGFCVGYAALPDSDAAQYLVNEAMKLMHSTFNTWNRMAQNHFWEVDSKRAPVASRRQSEFMRAFRQMPAEQQLVEAKARGQDTTVTRRSNARGSAATREQKLFSPHDRNQYQTTVNAPVSSSQATLFSFGAAAANTEYEQGSTASTGYKFG